MNKSNKFSPEVRERAVRMVQEHRGEYPSLWAAVESMAPKIGCVPQTLLSWVQRHEIDTGVRDGLTTVETQRVKELEREVKELRRPAPLCLVLPHCRERARLQWQDQRPWQPQGGQSLPRVGVAGGHELRSTLQSDDPALA